MQNFVCIDTINIHFLFLCGLMSNSIYGYVVYGNSAAHTHHILLQTNLLMFSWHSKAWNGGMEELFCCHLAFAKFTSF